MKNNLPTVIIGAGLAGLAAAYELERNGIETIILEKSNRVGGRIHTDHVNGWTLDCGFQVLLTAYPTAQKLLDYHELDLKFFLPGTFIYSDHGTTKIGDPSRNIGFLWTTLMSGVGGLGDQFKVLSLNSALKKMSLEEIFSEPETSALDFLRGYGFSTKIIDWFFKPFFTGIFLEPHLETSSRKFKFVFKMFAEGYAAIPANGMQAIPEQLASKLTKTEIRFNTEVAKLGSQKILLANGDEIPYSKAIVATSEIENKTLWNSCRVMYFTCEKSVHNAPIIGLLARENSVVNNIHFVSDLLKSRNKKEALLSVTIVDDKGLNPTMLEARVRLELSKFCDIKVNNLIRQYEIKKALPQINSFQEYAHAELLPIDEHTVRAGDHLNNGSINGALDSGLQAAEWVLERQIVNV